MEDLYRRLARHLDDLPGGFPASESGVELRILRRLFSEQEAELALHVSLLPECAGVIAWRAGIPRVQAESRLDELARKGLIMRLEGKTVQYVSAQFIIGIWEFHLNDLDLELIRDVEEYMPVLLPEAWKVPQLHTIPVNQSLEHGFAVFPYENAEEIVRRATLIVVAPCICRRERQMVGKGCSKLNEACLVFDQGADMYRRNRLGRPIDQTEALAILVHAEKDGLVLQPGNSQQPMNICCCCGCCCGVLRNLKAYPKPAELAASSFMAVSDSESCTGCGTCISRCQMSALSMAAEKAALNPTRCIGCGLCVSTCAAGALKLVRKPDAVQPKVPKNGIHALIGLGRARGKFGAVDFAKIMLKSKMDRLLAGLGH